MSGVLTRSEWIIWRGCPGASKASAAASISTAIFWSSRRLAARNPTGAALWMRLRKRPGTIRESAVQNSDEALDVEIAAHHQARPVGHIRVRAGGRARRMGGFRRLRVLEPGSCQRWPEAARGAPFGLSWDR